jgi:nuclear transcription Y subunit beta
MMDPKEDLMLDDYDEEADHGYREVEIREQDRYLPIANIARIMKRVLPGNAKIAKDAKESIQACVSEYISFITSEASDKCQLEKRKTINGDDLLWAMGTLGFEQYGEPLRLYLAKYRESVKGERPDKMKFNAKAAAAAAAAAAAGGGMGMGMGMGPSNLNMKHMLAGRVGGHDAPPLSPDGVGEMYDEHSEPFAGIDMTGVEYEVEDPNPTNRNGSSTQQQHTGKEVTLVDGKVTATTTAAAAAAAEATSVAAAAVEAVAAFAGAEAGSSSAAAASSSSISTSTSAAASTSAPAPAPATATATGTCTGTNTAPPTTTAASAGGSRAAEPASLSLSSSSSAGVAVAAQAAATAAMEGSSNSKKRDATEAGLDTVLIHKSV